MYLGIEIGGSKLQLGIGTGAGDLRHLVRLPADAGGGAAAIRRQTQEGMHLLLRQSGVSAKELQGGAIGFGGPVDDSSGSVLTSHQVAGWADFPLADWATQALGIPMLLANDADVAGLAEATAGAGKGLSPLFYITVGSGIGGALILDGHIYRGTGRGAAEIGHLWTEYRLDPWDPGSWCDLEAIASGWGLEKAAALALGVSTRLPDVVQRVADPRVQAVLQRGIRALALGISHVIALVCPRRIVIGGGVSLLGEELFFAPLRQAVQQIAFPHFAGCWEIVPAVLGEAVVVHGALEYARQRLSGQPS